MKLLCFGRIGELLGHEHALVMPQHVHTVADMLTWLRQQETAWRDELERPFRVAVNQCIVNAEFRVTDQDEVALLPPVSGG